MSAAPDGRDVPPVLIRHLATYLGQWPPGSEDSGAAEVVGSTRREAPAWDGTPVLAVAVRSPEGAVVSVPPSAVESVRSMAVGLRDPAFGDDLAAVVGAPRRATSWLVLRWTDGPAPLPDAGQWMDSSDPVLPDWLHPFPGRVLALVDDGRYLAGVGVKPHTEQGRELAVGTVETVRGRGLARRLVAQAARDVLSEGAIPLYVHHPDNLASARVADAAGFPDRGWRLLVVSAPRRRAP
ncbi:MAG: GNAT family N-acetyltransferase [Actinobacteria bacterium]|nr:GNAT family N-acetyltransferase [Actinomycetota bacterium]